MCCKETFAGDFALFPRRKEMVAAFDVSKAILDMSRELKVGRLGNRLGEIQVCLGHLPDDCVVAMESTGNYHRTLAREALKKGMTVYVVNPKRLAAYRKSEAVRGKTDRLDAQ